MSDAIGPRTYLVGCILPTILKDAPMPEDVSVIEKLNEAVRLALYVTDLTITKMSEPIVHDFEQFKSNILPKT